MSLKLLSPILLLSFQALAHPVPECVKGFENEIQKISAQNAGSSSGIEIGFSQDVLTLSQQADLNPAKQVKLGFNMATLIVDMGVGSVSDHSTKKLAEIRGIERRLVLNSNLSRIKLAKSKLDQAKSKLVKGGSQEKQSQTVECAIRFLDTLAEKQLQFL